jgi:pimeloyl-ACP methyl ester carboxylesterase
VADSLLDHPLLASRLFFPRSASVDHAFLVTAADGISKLACFRALPHPGAPTVLHFHGNGEVVSDYLPDMAEEFARLGVNSLFAEYRGYGGSDGSPALGSMLEDAAAVLEASGEEPANVVLFGRSIGSLFAIELAARYPSVRGLILESGIADVLERALFRVDAEELGASQADLEAAFAERFDHRAKLGRYRGPTLILHAANDRLVLASHAERNFAWSGAAEADKELILFRRGAHNSVFLANYAEYIDALRRFLGHLGARRTIPAAPHG